MIDYPRLYRRADLAAIKAQRAQFALLGAQLTSFMLAAGAGSTAALFTGRIQAVILAAVPISLGCGVLISVAIRLRQDEKAWFLCRAIAESVKSLTWRYAMGAAPFPLTAAEDARGRFTGALIELVGLANAVGHRLIEVDAPSASEITSQMGMVRSQNLPKRRDLYLISRVGEQATWYESSSRRHAQAGQFTSIASVVLQVLAITAAVVQMMVGPLPAGIVGVPLTAAASIIAWGHAKRHDELRDAYAIAALELAQLKALMEVTSDGQQFLELVIQAEDSISREHKAWCARRSVAVATYESTN